MLRRPLPPATLALIEQLTAAQPTREPEPAPAAAPEIRPANRHELRMVERGEAAGYLRGRYGKSPMERLHPAPECPYVADGRPRALWHAGKARGLARGLRERQAVRDSYVAAVAALDGPQRNAWGGTR